MEKHELKIVQQISKEILFEIADICERNNIEYFLLYGSLLGAVRHKGIIPWDDDIDIGMTRKNYLKFLEICLEQLSERNELTLMGSADSLSEMKIGRKGTLYCLRDAQNLKIASEITVDIFPVDYIKEKNSVRMRCDSKLRRFLRVCSLNWDEKKLLMISIKKSTHAFKSVYIAGLYILHSVRLLLGEDRINRMIYRMYVDTTGNSGRMGCAMIDSYTYPADYKITKMLFEERMLPVMDTYDEILTKQYGNYMEYPPEEKRYNSKMAEWVLQVEEL